MQTSKFFIIICFISFFSCTDRDTTLINAYSFATIKVDPRIKNQEIFRWLDNQKDYDMSGDGNRKKTSAALYYSKRKDEVEIPEYFSMNNCRAQIVNDTLVIRIGSTTYLSDYGMEIKYKNGKFFAIPFQTSDMIIDDEPKNKKQKEVYFSRVRKLILDKYNYKTGDDIFGRIHAEIELPNQKNMKNEIYTLEYVVDGYFRTKVSEL
jgi:hypothetical protein